MWGMIVPGLRAAFCLFLFLSFFSKAWGREGAENVAKGMNPALMMAGAWVQAFLMYGLPAGLLWWDWRIGAGAWFVMGVKLHWACYQAKDLMGGSSTSDNPSAEGTPDRRSPSL
jgi:hypothetical protein